MSEIATGVTSSLLARAADVTFKERRKLVLGLRETPLHSGHLRNLTLPSDAGAVIAPIVPAFHARPKPLEKMIGHTVGRVLDQLNIHTSAVHRWKDDNPATKEP